MAIRASDEGSIYSEANEFLAGWGRASLLFFPTLISNIKVYPSLPPDKAMLLRSSHLPEVRSSSGSKCILPEILASEILGMGRRWQKVAIGHEREWKRWIEEQRVIGIPVTTTDGSA
ncbi:uncharacterized protein LOC141509824 isoform X5 [Macrotis lagotis]|uniref:uncharacterized protein LOC141509824 isoform X5 n=1 Tax=Macrotis lagotis TaxID=92651 RepID=UPI003D692E72